MALIHPSELSQHHFDLCIIGMGPAGMTLALEAQKKGLTVLLVDEGNIDGCNTHHLQANIQSPEKHVPLSLGTYHGLGGTSWLWGGRCVPFEAIDFACRPYVAHSGWPIQAEDIEPWYDIAAKYVDCGNGHFRDNNKWDKLSEFELSQHERWAQQPKLAKKLKPLLIDSSHIFLLCDTWVNHIQLDSTNRITHLTASCDTKQIRIEAADYILACGAISTTYLLLKLQQEKPALFGGSQSVLGQYYMGHLFGSIADIILADPEKVEDLDFHQDKTNTYIRKRFTPTVQTQQTHALLNTSFHIDNPPFYDASHGNPTLSLVFIALYIPFIGRRLVSEAIRLQHLGSKPYRLVPHLLNIVRHPLRMISDMSNILRYRYFSKVRKSGFILRNKKGIYALKFHSEQIPQKSNAITLTPSQSDRIDIAFSYAEQDIDSVIKTHELLDLDLRTHGYGHLQYHVPKEQLRSAVMKQAADGFHQVGTTRMGNDASTSIVNKDCRVHDISNLYIVSSSVFPTTGEANPTFLITVLAARLASYLADKHQHS